jgi:hypothetical protein
MSAETSTLAEEPRSTVEAFISAMNRWEIDAWQLSRTHRNSPEPGAYWPEIQRALLTIHQTLCTPKRRVYASQPTFQKPPGYDPATEKVTAVSVEGRRALVDTQRNAILGSGQYRYVLHKKGDRWLIDNVKFFSDGKWTPHIL